MKLVSIQSPYAGDVARNMIYARRALYDSLKRGEAPFVSHLLYPQILNDDMPEERALGLACDYAFLAVCEWAAFYADLGFSKGMVVALEKAHDLNMQVRIRHIGV